MRRQLHVGETLGEAFSAYGAHAGVLLPLAFWLFLAVGVLDGVAGSSFALLSAGIVVGTVAGTVYKGMVVGLVRDVREGRPEPSVGELFANVVPVLVPLLLAGLLAGIAIFAGMLLLLVPGLFLLTIWSLIAPAIVIERKGLLEAFGRSRQLVRGHGWPVFGVLIVALLITAVVSLLFLQVAAAIAGGPLLRIVFSALAVTIAAPVEGLVAGVLYYRLAGFQAPPGGPEPVDVPPPVA
jgi:hypothetical protein